MAYSKVTLTLPPIPPLVNGATIVVDATMREHHDHRSTVTEHPVETGSTISDNIRPLPRRLSLQCLISPAPLTFTGSAPDAGIVSSAYNLLEIARSSASAITVDTGLRNYPAMAIESLGVPKESGLGDNLFFDLELVEIVYATFQTTQVPASAIKTLNGQRQGAVRTSRGFNPATPYSGKVPFRR